MAKKDRWDPNKYNNEKYERVSVVIPKGSKEGLKKLAAADGQSVNRYILEAVERRSGLSLTLDNSLPDVAAALGYDLHREKWAPTPTAGNAPETPQDATGAILESGAVSLPSGEGKRPQNALHEEMGRTPCTVDSKIYSYAINGAKVKGQTVSQYLDKAVEVWNYETAKLLAAKANEPTAEEKAEFKLKMQHDEAQRRRETVPGDWRKNSDSTTPADPERGEAHFLASLALIQRKADEAKQKAAKTEAENEPADHAEPT